MHRLSNKYSISNPQIVRLANDAKGKGGERQFNGLVDVYVKTLKSDGIQGLYRGFVISAVGIFIYRGMYFGLYDTLKPLVLGADAGVTLSFLLGWAVTVTAGLMSYPIDTVRSCTLHYTARHGSCDIIDPVIDWGDLMSAPAEHWVKVTRVCRFTQLSK